MQYSVIRKMEKARQYAEQKERVAISSINTTFHGNHSDHHVTFQRRQMVLLMRLFLRLRNLQPHHGLGKNPGSHDPRPVATTQPLPLTLLRNA